MKKLLLIITIFLSIKCTAQTNPVEERIDAAQKVFDGIKLQMDSLQTGVNLERYDTVPCVMLVCDTMHYSNYTPQLNDKNYFDKSGVVTWCNGYSVREKHNTSEGEIDPGFYRCIDQRGNVIPCYHDYWQHIQYLDSNKQPLATNIIVWQSVNQ